MSYIEESLSNGESVREIFYFHWITTYLIFLGFLAAVLTLGVWLLPAILQWLTWKYTEQGVTNKRIITKYGIISRHTNEIKLTAIESVSMTQGIVARLFGYGTVKVTGRGNACLTINWVEDPVRVKRELENAHSEALRRQDEAN